MDGRTLSGTVYIPDTSALIENPDALDRLLTDGNVVVLLHRVIEELGHLAGSRAKPEGVRHAARQVTRKILDYRQRALIHHHVERLLQGAAGPGEFRPTPAGGILAWEPDGGTAQPYAEESGDNLILAGARRVAALSGGNGHPGWRVVVVSEDSNLLLKCDAVGVEAEPLRYGKVELESVEEVYRGVVEAGVAPDAIDAFLASGAPTERWLPLEALPEALRPGIVWNTGVILTDGERTVLTRANPDAGRLEDLRHAQYWDRKRGVYRPRPVLGFTPRDAEQTLAMEFLLDPEVQLVVLDGPAGSGKTRLMVTAALYLLLGQPSALRVSRGSARLVEDHGFDRCQGTPRFPRLGDTQIPAWFPGGCPPARHLARFEGASRRSR